MNISELKHKFLETLAEHGGSAGNYAMMRSLDLEENEYWTVRNKVLDDGRIILGRGRGGSVILVTDDEGHGEGDDPGETSTAPGQEVDPDPYPNEASLYAPCLDTLNSNWAAAHRLFRFRGEVTANQGSKKTGGIWTRPDVAAMSVRTFPYWPGRHFDLWTFEIKPRGQFNVLGLFEALAHARMATHSWALFHVSEETRAAELNIERMTAEAQRLGVGFIMFTDPANFETWDIRVNSVRMTPDPALHDEFVRTQFSDGPREELLQWAR